MDANENDSESLAGATRQMPDWWNKIAARAASVQGDAEGEERGRPEAAATEPDASPLAVGNAGGCLSNTHQQSSQVVLNDYQQYMASGGIDWFEWSAAVDWSPVCFQYLMAKLGELKAACQNERVSDKWLELEGFPIRVARTGLNRGGDSGHHCEFKICYDGVWIGLANRSTAFGGPANLAVRLGGRECLLLGARTAYERCRHFVDSLGGMIQQEKLSRVDLCLDVCNLGVQVIRELIDQRQFITRAKKGSMHENVIERKSTGISLGKRPLRIIIYDKIEEQREKADQLVAQALIDRRYGGVLPEKATRFEFQLGRSWLMRYGIDSPANLFEQAPQVLDKLTDGWFRLTAAPVDRENKHQARAENHPLWESLRAAFFAVFGQPYGSLVPVRRERVNPVRLVKQGLGCFRNAMLQTDQRSQTINEFLSRLSLMVQNTLSPAEQAKFMKDFLFRQTEYKT